MNNIAVDQPSAGAVGIPPFFVSNVPFAYEVSFWLAYLGHLNYAILKVIQSHQGISAGRLEKHLGEGTTRHTLVGRAGRNGSPAQIGAIEKLETLGFIRKTVKPNGHYALMAPTFLPMLTPSEVSTLPKLIQKAHADHVADHLPCALLYEYALMVAPTFVLFVWNPLYHYTHKHMVKPYVL